MRFSLLTPLRHRFLFCLKLMRHSCVFSYTFVPFSYAFVTSVMPLRPKSHCVVNVFRCGGQPVVRNKSAYCNVDQIM